MGDFNQLFSRLPAALKDIHERGNLFSETSLRLRTTYIRFLVADEVDNAREELDQTIGRWSQSGFHMQHFWYFFGRTQTLLYAGDAAGAWQLIKEKEAIVARSFLLRIQPFYFQALHLRARSALAFVAQERGSASLLRIAERDARMIEKENMPWGNAFARQIRAGIAAARGETAKAIEFAASAEASFEAVDMALYAAATRRRRGQLIGGDEGRKLVEEAETWMAGQKIKNPDRMTDMLAPGKWEG